MYQIKYIAQSATELLLKMAFKEKYNGINANCAKRNFN